MRALLPVLGMAVGLFGGLGVNYAITQHQKAPSPVLTECEYEVYGACILKAGKVSIDKARMEKAFEIAAAYWDTDVWAAKNWTVVIHDRDPFMLGSELVWGVNYMTLKRFDFAAPRVTCPEPVFIHEWGHLALPKGDHEDPRYEDENISKALAVAGLEGC